MKIDPNRSKLQIEPEKPDYAKQIADKTSPQTLDPDVVENVSGESNVFRASDIAGPLEDSSTQKLREAAAARIQNETEERLGKPQSAGNFGFKAESGQGIPGQGIDIGLVPDLDALRAAYAAGENGKPLELIDLREYLKAMQDARSQANPYLQGILDRPGDAGESVPDLTGSIGDALDEQIPTEDDVNAIRDLADGFRQSEGFFESIAGDVGDAAGDVLDAVSDLFGIDASNASDFVRDRADSAGEAVDDVVETATEAAEDAVETVTQAAEDVVDWVESWFD